jgi:diguanylate cyclase (GGDEF)-like protein
MVVTRVATHFALSLSNIRLREALRAESIHDPLTGLYNRRYMEQSLTREIPRAKRHNFQVGFIMLDIDRFKTFNETYGHEVGDMMLQKLGTYLKENVRNEDISCRYDGEEFMLILPDISLRELTKRAENLRLGIQTEVKIEHHDTILSITISLGVACFPEHGTDIQEIIKASNIALQQAKTEGGDKVVIVD